jgi:hypothetical protein
MPCHTISDPNHVSETWTHVQALIKAAARGDAERADSVLKDLHAGRAVLWIVPADKIAEGSSPAIVEVRWVETAEGIAGGNGAAR